MKKICVLFGNCQCSGIREFLKFSNFYSEYEIYQYANWQLIKNESALPIKILLQADLVIYQPLKDVYGCYSTNSKNEKSFINLLKPECIKISFPRIYNNALFPIFKKHQKDNIYYGKIDKSRPLQEILNDYKNNKLNFDFTTRWDENIKIGYEKEKDCDIKIMDYIIENISNYKLFLTHEHPTSQIFNEITKQICKILNLEYNCNIDLVKNENITNLLDSVYLRKSKQYPISRYTIKHYNLKYKTTEDEDADDFYIKNIINYYNNK